jgi:hypothetical protein
MACCGGPAGPSCVGLGIILAHGRYRSPPVQRGMWLANLDQAQPEWPGRVFDRMPPMEWPTAMAHRLLSEAGDQQPGTRRKW